jgi:MFS family permease
MDLIYMFSSLLRSALQINSFSHHVIILVELANGGLFSSAFGSSIYTPAIPDVMRDFGVSETVAILPLTTYVLSLSFASMISAPVSETMGRLGTYRVALPISIFFTIGCGFAPTFAALCVLRFFAGLFGSACFAVCSGTSADLFHPEHRAVAASFLLYFPFLGGNRPD